MNRVFKNFLNTFVIIFTVDILVYSKIKKKHEWKQQLYTKFSNCEFWLLEVVILVHVITKEGIFVDATRVEAVMKMP